MKRDDSDACSARWHLGRFRVDTSAPRVARFREAIELDVAGSGAAHDAVPITFPICWLTSPEITAALTGRLRDVGMSPGQLPIHLQQEIILLGPLEIDTAYWLNVTLAGPDVGLKFRVEAEVTAEDGSEVATLVVGLALVVPAGRPA